MKLKPTTKVNYRVAYEACYSRKYLISELKLIFIRFLDNFFFFRESNLPVTLFSEEFNTLVIFPSKEFILPLTFLSIANLPVFFCSRESNLSLSYSANHKLGESSPTTPKGKP